MILVENKFTSHLQSLARTLVNSCIVYAKPTVRNRRTEMAQCPACAPKGVLHASFECLFWCCVFPQKMPLIPLRDTAGFLMGCSTLLVHLQPSTPETTSPGVGASALSGPFTLCSSLDWMFPSVASSASPGTKSSMSFWITFPWRLKVVSLLPCLCSERTCFLKHVQSEQTQQAQGWERKPAPFASPSC